jgi:hypothetical protein
MVLIGFGHRARQGKNTAAQAVLESLPIETDVRMYAFSDALKREVRVACATLGGQGNLIQQFKEAGLLPEWVHFEEPKPRTLLQHWGQDRRTKDPLYWVKRLFKTMDAHSPAVALITDVRYPNERDYIRSRGGVYVEVLNTGPTDVEVHEHSSESALDGTDYDFLIAADTAESCRKQAIDIYSRIVRTRE